MRETNTYEIGHIFVNDKGYLSLRSLVGLMFDVSFRQSEKIEKNLGLEDCAWLVYSWDIEIKSPARLGDKLEITTIPTHMKRFYAYRNFLVTRNGEEIIRAKATFILFDRNKMRPVVIDEKILDAYGREDVLYEGENIGKIKNLDKCAQIVVRKADLDQNGHVNNGIYFDYIKEIPGFSDEKVAFIKLVYKNEIKLGDEISLGLREANGLEFSLDSSDKNHAYGVIRYV